MGHYPQTHRQRAVDTCHSLHVVRQHRLTSAVNNCSFGSWSIALLVTIVSCTLCEYCFHLNITEFFEGFLTSCLLLIVFQCARNLSSLFVLSAKSTFACNYFLWLNVSSSPERSQVVSSQVSWPIWSYPLARKPRKRAERISLFEARPQLFELSKLSVANCGCFSQAINSALFQLITFYVDVCPRN